MSRVPECLGHDERQGQNGCLLLGMPSSWNQLKQSGFPLDDYAKEMPIGEYEVIVDGVCYAKSSSRTGTGIHVFGRIRERKALVLCPLPARTCLPFASQRAEGRRSGSPDSGSRSQWPGADKGCGPRAGGKIKPPIRCRPEPGVGAGRGRSEWAGEAKRVGKVALVCSRPEAGRGKDSPPRRLQTSAIKARVRQGVQGNSLS